MEHSDDSKAFTDLNVAPSKGEDNSDDSMDSDLNLDEPGVEQFEPEHIEHNYEYLENEYEILKSILGDSEELRAVFKDRIGIKFERVQQPDTPPLISTHFQPEPEHAEEAHDYYDLATESLELTSEPESEPEPEPESELEPESEPKPEPDYVEPRLSSLSQAVVAESSGDGARRGYLLPMIVIVIIIAVIAYYSFDTSQQLNTEIDSLQSELAESSERIEEISREKIHSEPVEREVVVVRESEPLKEEIAKLSTTTQELRSELEEARQSDKADATKSQPLEEELAKLSTTTQELRSELAEVRRAGKEKEADVADSEKDEELTAIHHKLDELQSIVKASTSDSEKGHLLEGEIAKLNATIEGLRSELDEVRRTDEVKKASTAEEKDKELIALKKQLQELQGKVEESSEQSKKARAAAEAAVAESRKKAIPVVTRKDGKEVVWSVNLYSAVTRSNGDTLEKLREELAQFNLKPEVIKIKKDGVTWYRTRILGFASLKSAKDYALRLKETFGINAWVSREEMSE